MTWAGPLKMSPSFLLKIQLEEASGVGWTRTGRITGEVEGLAKEPSGRVISEPQEKDNNYGQECAPPVSPSPPALIKDFGKSAHTDVERAGLFLHVHEFRHMAFCATSWELCELILSLESA